MPPSETAPAQAGALEVVMNQAKIVKLSSPADTIVIGNPLIADASVQDATTVVLTGKGAQWRGVPLPDTFPTGTAVHDDLAAFAEALIAQTTLPKLAV